MQLITVILFLAALAFVPLVAQDATPSPTAAASPVAEPAGPTPSPSPAPADAPPAAVPTPAPVASPAPAAGEDVIPLPPEAGAGGAPIVSEGEVPNMAKPDPGAAPLPDSAFTDPNGVIPDSAAAAVPPLPSGPSAEELQRKIKIRFKEVRTQVEKDPAVSALLEEAKKARTFEDERAAYREYYRLLFRKMKKVDKELTARCDAMEKAYIARLAQTRLEPTIPLNLPPKPEPLSN